MAPNLLFSLPHVKFYVSFYFSLHQRPHLLLSGPCSHPQLMFRNTLNLHICKVLFFKLRPHQSSLFASQLGFRLRTLFPLCFFPLLAWFNLKYTQVYICN